MDDEKKIIEKRSSLRGWKERNKRKPYQKIYIIGVVMMIVVLSAFVMYPYIYKENKNFIPNASPNSSSSSSNISPVKVVTPKITPSKITTPKATPVVTPASNISGKMGIPLALNGFEITVINVTPTTLYTNVRIIAKNTGDVEKPFKIGPSTVVIDNIGEQYENVHVKRSSEIIQTNLTAKAMREGTVFFEPLREGRNPKKMIININGQKAEIMFER